MCPACRLKFTATVEEGGLSISALAHILTQDQDQDTLLATLMCSLLKGMGKARGAGCPPSPAALPACMVPSCTS